MSISNYLNKLITIKNDLVNILKPFNSSINSNSKYDELVTSVRDASRSIADNYDYNGSKTIIGIGNNGDIIYKGIGLAYSGEEARTGLDRHTFNNRYMIPYGVTNCARAVSSHYNFNQPIIIPNTVTDCSFMFEYCNNFKQPIVIPEGVTSCRYMFQNCNLYINDLVIPYTVTDCYYMFSNCANVPKNIYVMGRAYSGSNMFYGRGTGSMRVNVYTLKETNATNFSSGFALGNAGSYWYNATYNIYIYNTIESFHKFHTNYLRPPINYSDTKNFTIYFNSNNQQAVNYSYNRNMFELSHANPHAPFSSNFPSTIGKYVQNLSYSFYQTLFNQPITIPYSVTDCSHMFDNSLFNQPINIPYGVTDCSGMFYYEYDSDEWDHEPVFNQPVTISSSVTNCNLMFYGCHNFNQPITIPYSVTDCGYIFSGCSNFNQSINIPGSAKSCPGMFYECYNFNRPITILYGVTDCSYMFYSCRNFNQPINIPNSVINCHSMFVSCWRFNRTVTIPNSATDCIEMFYNCINMNSNIYIKSNKVNNCIRMLYNHNTFKRINIHISNTNSDMINLFTNTSASYSITGKAITYTSSANLYYNTTQNIYIYTNYTW